MKKVFKMENVDCAHCAQKMEDGIKKIAGVEDASVNFLMQKLTIVADEAAISGIVEEARKVCNKVDKDCEILA